MSSQILILMYHAIAEVELDPWGLCVTPQHFSEHLEILRKRTRLLTVEQFVQKRKSNNFTQNVAVITFDDGYRCNLEIVLPLLKRFDIPATFFITTGYLGQPRPFWWDELQAMLLRPGTLPPELSFTVSGRNYGWQLSSELQYSESDLFDDRDRRPWEAKSGSRLSFYYSVWQALRPLGEADRQTALDEIRAWSLTVPTKENTLRTLSPDQMVMLGSSELAEIGAHSISHPNLPDLSLVDQRSEIDGSKIGLEKLLNREVVSFAYPYGEYSPDTIPIVREAGFIAACTTNEGKVEQNTNSYELPRLGVSDCDGDEFSRRIEKWFA